ncbi:MAG TPA: hypothetical protein VFQ91_12845 [Bryobacteraceae bacterium]|nr:hypothetical protein [Bryobacteraceae bacterium]
MSAELPALPVCEFTAAVQQQLLQLAFETFTSKPGEGVPVEGFLLGFRETDLLTITDISTEKNERTVLGRWVLRRRARTLWSAEDEERLADVGMLAVVAPVTVHRAEAVIWQLRNGTPTARRITFQSGTSVPKQSAAAAVMEREPSESAPSIRERIPPRFDFRQAMRWVGAACMAVGLWMTVTWVGSVNQAAGGPAPRLALKAYSQGEVIRVHWKEELGGDWARLDSAALHVRRGDQEETVDLTERYVPDGQVSIPTPTGDMVISLRVRRDGLPTGSQTLTYLIPKPRPEILQDEIVLLRKRIEELEEHMRILR